MLELVKALCNKDIYEQIGRNVPVTAFEKEPKRIVETIISAQDAYDNSINLSELENLFFSNNNSLTKAQEDSYKLLFAKMKQSEDISVDVAKDVMHNLWRIEIGRRVSEIGYALTEGEETSLDSLSKLIDDYASGFLPDASNPLVEVSVVFSSFHLSSTFAIGTSSVAELSLSAISG